MSGIEEDRGVAFLQRSVERFEGVVEVVALQVLVQRYREIQRLQRLGNGTSVALGFLKAVDFRIFVVADDESPPFSRRWRTRHDWRQP